MRLYTSLVVYLFNDLNNNRNIMNPNTLSTFPILAEQGKTWVLVRDLTKAIAEGEEFIVYFDAFTGLYDNTEEYEVECNGYTLRVEVVASIDTLGELTSRAVSDWNLCNDDTNEEPLLNSSQKSQIEQAIIKNIIAG